MGAGSVAFWENGLSHFSSLWLGGLRFDDGGIQTFSAQPNSAPFVLHDSNEQCWSCVSREEAVTGMASPLLVYTCVVISTAE